MAEHLLSFQKALGSIPSMLEEMDGTCSIISDYKLADVMKIS